MRSNTDTPRLYSFGVWYNHLFKYCGYLVPLKTARICIPLAQITVYVRSSFCSMFSGNLKLGRVSEMSDADMNDVFGL